MLHFRLIAHIRYIVNSDKCQRIFFVDEVHQLLIFCFIYNCDNLVALLHIVGTIGLIDSGAAVQLMDNEVSKLFFFFCDDAYTTFDIVVEDKVIEHDTVEVSSEDTQDNGLFVIDKRGRKSYTHAGEGHCFS